VFFGITPKQYENMSLNTVEIDRFMKEALWLFRYYRGGITSEYDAPLSR